MQGMDFKNVVFRTWEDIKIYLTWAYFLEFLICCHESQQSYTSQVLKTLTLYSGKDNKTMKWHRSKKVTKILYQKMWFQIASVYRPPHTWRSRTVAARSIRMSLFLVSILYFGYITLGNSTKRLLSAISNHCQMSF